MYNILRYISIFKTILDINSIHFTKFNVISMLEFKSVSKILEIRFFS